MDEEKILTDEEIQFKKENIINELTKIDKAELIKYELEKPKKKSFFDKLKIILGYGR